VYKINEDVFIAGVNNSCDYFRYLILALLKVLSVIFVTVVTIAAVLIVMAPSLLILALSTLIFVPEYLAVVVWNTSVVEVIFTLMGHKFFWMNLEYEGIVVLGVFGFGTCLGIAITHVLTYIFRLIVKCTRSIPPKTYSQVVPHQLQDVYALFKTRFVDKICVKIEPYVSD